MSFVLFVMPMIKHPACEIIVLKEDKGRACSLDTALPLRWEGRHIPHFMPFYQPASFGASHLACIESMDEGIDGRLPLYFNGEIVNSNSTILLFDEPTQEYRWIPTKEQCNLLVNFFVQRQEQWKTIYEQSPFRSGQFSGAPQARH